MNSNARILSFLVLTLAGWTGCSSKPSANEGKKAAAALDRIQGKAQVLIESGGALDAALDRLAKMDARQAQIVELRFFAGLNVEETAEVMGISARTVKREWRSAKAWLSRELAAVKSG